MMCLYVDDDGESGTLIEEGERRARKEHKCGECSRIIESGETYQFWTFVGGPWSDGFETNKMCPHCWGTIVLGSELTGCPRSWWWDMVHDLDVETGFVGNCLGDDGHHLSKADRYRLLRTVVGRRRQWRDRSGQLYPIPTATQLEGAA